MSEQSDRQLYFISGSPPCWSVMLALAVKGLPYEPKRLDNSKGEQKAPGFRAINPRGHVPVLIEKGTAICETLAVLAYLDAAHPAPPLFGQSAGETAHIWQIISETDAHLRDPVTDITRPLFRGKEQDFADQIAAAAPKVRDELAFHEVQLKNRLWLAGEQVSAADLIVYPVVMQLQRAAAREGAASFALNVHPLSDHYPALGAWVDRIAALPGYDDAYPPHWKQ